jgi:hypothetical protein
MRLGILLIALSIIVGSTFSDVQAQVGRLAKFLSSISREAPHPPIPKIRPEHPPVEVPTPIHTQSSSERSLALAYENKAPHVLSAISNVDQQSHIKSILASHPIRDVAAFAGRERQFQRATDHIDYTVQYHLLRVEDLTDEEAAVVRLVLREHVRGLVSAASEQVPISAFSSSAVYKKALMKAVLEFAELRKQAGETWKFNVQSGTLELPFKKKIWNVEFTAGEVDLGNLAANAAQFVFSAPSSTAATSDKEETSTADTIKEEESGRRRIVEALSADEIAELKEVAPSLFVG